MERMVVLYVVTVYVFVRETRYLATFFQAFFSTSWYLYFSVIHQQFRNWIERKIEAAYGLCSTKYERHFSLQLYTDAAAAALQTT